MPFSLNGERIVKARTATARLPNYATARRRGCRTARLPSGAWALRARLLSVSGFCDGRTALPRRHFGHRVALNVARPSAEGRLRLSARAPFGSRAVWQSRPSAVARLPLRLTTLRRSRTALLHLPTHARLCSNWKPRGSWSGNIRAWRRSRRRRVVCR